MKVWAVVEITRDDPLSFEEHIRAVYADERSAHIEAADLWERTPEYDRRKPPAGVWNGDKIAWQGYGSFDFGQPFYVRSFDVLSPKVTE
jgi:hypothetical protein